MNSIKHVTGKFLKDHKLNYSQYINEFSASSSRDCITNKYEKDIKIFFVEESQKINN